MLSPGVQDVVCEVHTEDGGGTAVHGDLAQLPGDHLPVLGNMGQR